MHNAEGLNFRVVSTGRDDVDGRRPSNFKTVTLQQIHRWLDGMDLAPDVLEAVRKSAEGYPHQALGSFKRNFSRTLAKIQKDLAITRQEPKQEIKEL